MSERSVTDVIRTDNLPKGWEMNELDDVVEFTDGDVFVAVEHSEYTDEFIVWERGVIATTANWEPDFFEAVIDARDRIDEIVGPEHDEVSSPPEIGELDDTLSL